MDQVRQSFTNYESILNIPMLNIYNLEFIVIKLLGYSSSNSSNSDEDETYFSSANKYNDYLNRNDLNFSNSLHSYYE